MSDAAAETIEAPRDKMSVAPLEWIKPDDYHIETKCGRYSVARVSVKPFVHYIAWRLPVNDARTGQPVSRLRELDHVKLAARDPKAKDWMATISDDDRMAAIKRMQQVCVEDSRA